MRDLNQIRAANANTDKSADDVRVSIRRVLLEQLVDALRTAQASLNDVLVHGSQERQRRNINNVDLPVVSRAIAAGKVLLAVTANKREDLDAKTVLAAPNRSPNPVPAEPTIGNAVNTLRVIAWQLGVEKALTGPIADVSEFALDRFHRLLDIVRAAQQRFDAILRGREAARAEERRQEREDG